MFIATLETSNFTFEAFGATRKEARQALEAGWTAHRINYGVTDTEDSSMYAWSDVKEDMRVREVHFGQCWRDMDRILVGPNKDTK